MSETGFDSLVLVRVGFFVAEISFDVCVRWLCSNVVPNVFHGFCDPLESRSSNSSVRGGPWYDVSFIVSRKCYVFHRIFVWHFVYSAEFLHSAV